MLTERLPRPLPPVAAWREDALRVLGGKTLVLLRRALFVLLAGYLLFDRGFAWLHVPGVRVFPGELLVALALVVFALSTGYLRHGLRRTQLLMLLAVFAFWGLVQMVPNVGTYGINAIRDSALWYYAAIAVAVVVLAEAWPDLPERTAELFARFIPVLLAWSPVAIVLAQAVRVPLSVPDADGVLLFSHKTNNIAVNAAIAVAFLWLVPTLAPPQRQRQVLTVLAIAVIAAVGTQNRGGVVSAAVALALAWCLARQRVRLATGVIAVTLALLVGAWALNARVPSETNRDISVAQLVENLASLSDPNADTDLAGTITWRSELWGVALGKLSEENRVLSGFGFGPNLGSGLGFPASPPGEPALRSPHNSHLDVVVRMGLVGAVLWAALWGCWFWQLVSARRRLRASAHDHMAGLVEVCLVAAAGLLVNAIFDPTLESPQVAVFLWTVFGLGVVLAARRGPRLAGATESP